MTVIKAGSSLSTVLSAGGVLEVIASAGANARYIQIESSNSGPNPIGAGTSFLIGPFPETRIYKFEVITGTVDVSPRVFENTLCTLLGSVHPFTGNLTLSTEHISKILRCDGGSPVTVTVPASLPVGFTCAVAQWGAGTITFVAGSGMTNRNAFVAVRGQYFCGSVIVIKAGEFVLRGDVVE